MRYSFAFDGVDAKDLQLHYVPENADTYTFGVGQYENHEQKFDAHDGGYYYGNTMQPKTFTLRCYYEKTKVDDGFFTRLHAFFRRGRRGRLTFSARPWLYYVCTVTGVDTSRLINLENGLVTISMTAYYPYALTDYGYIEAEIEGTNALVNSAMFKDDIMPQNTFTEIDTQKTVLLYNGGTERAAVTIDIAGDMGTGVTIYNKTTGQECFFNGLNEGSENKYVEYDGMSGNCYWVSNDSDNGKNAFLYHGYGSIELEPAYPIIRDVDIVYTQGSTEITSEYSAFDKELIGQYVYCDGVFRKIVNVPDEHTLTVSTTPSNSGSANDAVIVTMNEIIITPDTSMNLSYLSFKSKHTFA